MKNLDLLIQVADHVLPNTEALLMSNWIGEHPYGLGVESKEKAVCNTTACVAGWACILSGESKLKHDVMDNGKKFAYWESPVDGWEAGAYRIFGAETDDEEEDLSRLFYSDNDRALEVLRLIKEGESLADALEDTLYLVD